MSFVVALHAATYTLSFRLCWTTAGRRRSKTHKRFEIMHLRIRMLRLATAALAIAARCSTAFVFPRGRQQQTLQGGGGGGESTHQRQWGTGDTSSHAAPLSSKKIKANKRTQGAPPPWLTSVAGLRGGARASGEGGGSSVAVARGGAQVAAPSTTRLRRSMSICGLFGLSYLCSVLFNVNNKRALLLVPLPWTYAAINLSIGSVMALVAWSAKVAPWPKIEWQDAGALVPMGLLHAVSHLTVVLGLGAGAVSFLQTVKASEACFTALLSHLFLGQTLPLPVYLTLLPVVLGVALTCCGQGLRFSWLALLSALVSNLSNALRNVLIVKNIGPAAAAARRQESDGAKTQAKDNERAGMSPPRSASSSFLRSTSSSATVSPAAADAFVNNPVSRKMKSGGALANTRAGGLTAAGATARRQRSSGLLDLAPGDTFRLCSVVGAALLIPAAAYFERGSWPRLWRGAADAAAALVGRKGGSDGGSTAFEEALRAGAGAAAAAADGEGIGGGGATAAVAVAEAAAAAAVRGDWAEAFRRAMLSGVCFNLFYDLTFRLLGQLHPVTHAVGNTIKRIVVIAAGAFVFGGDLGGVRGAMGSGLAVLGVLAYSVAKAWCQPTRDHGGRSSR